MNYDARSTIHQNGKVFTSKFVGTGPSSYENRIYRAAVSQRLRNTALGFYLVVCLPEERKPQTQQTAVGSAVRDNRSDYREVLKAGLHWSPYMIVGDEPPKVNSMFTTSSVYIFINNEQDS